LTFPGLSAAEFKPWVNESDATASRLGRRLQTERDKARVLEALRSAAGDTDVAALDAAIGGLERRQFMLVSSKRSQPQLFATRWAMSFLRGPLTKDQVATLMKDVPRVAEAPSEAAAPESEAAPTPTDSETPVAPTAASGVPVQYLDPAAPWAPSVGAASGGMHLRAFVAARVNLRYDDSTAGIDEAQEFEALYGPPARRGPRPRA
jgi:hypothetical protein